MSSWRNVLKQKIHLERAQPANRKRFGLLEKHKDYKLRSTNYHRKEEVLKNLRLKAAMKNPDEFYHKMISLKKNKGDPKNKVEFRMSEKGHDAKFLVARRVAEEKKIDKEAESLHFVANDINNKHTLFMEKKEDIENFDPVDYFHTTPELVEQKQNRLTIEDLKNKKIIGNTDSKSLKSMKKHREGKYLKLQKKMEEAEQVNSILSHVEFQKNMMEAGRKRKVIEAEDGKPAVFKWQYQRKK
ncbi:hypothetical protein WA158_002352 [Blastocystis sp. Blastoise]